MGTGAPRPAADADHDAPVQRLADRDRERPGIVAWDGTLIAAGTYATFDPGWLLAAVKYALLKAGIDGAHSFGTSPQTITVSSSNVRIAIVGDWGTGIWKDGQLTCPSQQVMAQIKALDPAPDYVIHLGDTYYAGTDNLDFIHGEEQNNLVTLWPTQFANSLALNSNHEMYDGANGYFSVALGDNGRTTPFTLQTGTSYFALQGPTSSGPNWALVGLDSAYYDPSDLIMMGSINDTQLQFLAGFKNVPLVIVMTHHNGISTDGASPVQPLLGQVQSNIGNGTVVWYWGHVHNGVVYTANSAAGAILARCCGHGAIPFGGSAYLNTVMNEPNSPIAYFADTPLTGGDPQQGNRVLNGFAVIDLSTGTSGTTVNESFIDQEGNTAWTNSFTCPASGSGS